MEKKFEIKQVLPGESGYPTSPDWVNRTYDANDPDETSQRSEADGIEVIVHGDDFHYTTSNRPIIQTLDNTLADDIKIQSYMSRLKGLVRTDNDGFGLTSFYQKNLAFKRGIYIVNGKYIDFLHKVYKGKTTTLSSDIIVEFPDVYNDGYYTIQVDDNADIWADPTPETFRLNIGIAKFLNGEWVSYEDTRSFIGEGDESGTDTIKNKFISNYLAKLQASHDGRLTILETTDKPTLRTDVNQLARDLYTSGYEFSGEEFEGNVEQRLFDIDNQLADHNNRLDIVDTNISIYNKQLNLTNDSLTKVEEIDREQQLQLDYIKSNAYKNLNARVENFTFSIKDDDDDSIETDTNELAQSKVKTIVKQDPKYYRYKDYTNKLGLKEGFLTAQQKYYWGELVDYWDSIENLGDIEYDSVNDCFWGVSNALNTQVNFATFFKFTIDDKDLNVVGQWRVPTTWLSTSDTTKLLSGITILGNYIVLLITDYSSTGTNIFYAGQINNLPTTGNIIDTSWAEFTATITGTYLYGLTSIDDNNFRTIGFKEYGPGTVAIKEFNLSSGGIIEETTLKRNITPYIISFPSTTPNRALFGIYYDKVNQVLYVSDYDDATTSYLNKSNLYIFDASEVYDASGISTDYNCIGILKLSSTLNSGLTMKKGDLFIANTTNKTIDKRKIKNSVVVNGQITEWNIFPNIGDITDATARSACWDPTDSEWFVLFSNGTTKNYIQKYSSNFVLTFQSANLGSGNLKQIASSAGKIFALNTPSVYPPWGTTEVYEITTKASPSGLSPFISNGTYECYGSMSIAVDTTNDILYVCSGSFAVEGGINRHNVWIYKFNISGGAVTASSSDRYFAPDSWKVDYFNYYSSGYYYIARGSIWGYYGMAIDETNNIMYALGTKVPFTSGFSKTDDGGNIILKINLNKNYAYSANYYDAFMYPFVEDRFQVILPRDKFWSTTTTGLGGMAFKNNSLYLYSAYMQDGLAKVWDNTHYDNWIYHWNTHTTPIDSKSAVTLSNTAIDYSSTIEYCERYYSPTDYSNKHYILPEKFVVITNSKGLTILDVTNPRNPIKFIHFEGGSTNALYATGNTNYIAKIYKDAIYYGGDNGELGIIDFKNNYIQIFYVDGTNPGIIKYYNSADPIRERNQGKGFVELTKLNATLSSLIYSDFAIKEINGEIYWLVGYNNGTYYGVSIINVTKKQLYTGHISASGYIYSVYIADDNKFYFVSSDTTNYPIVAFGDISKIKSSNGSGFINWRNDTGYYKTYNASSALNPVLPSNDFRKIVVKSEYDSFGIWKTNKIYFTYGVNTTTEGFGVIDEILNTSFIFSSSPSGTAAGGYQFNLFDDNMFFSEIYEVSTPTPYDYGYAYRLKKYNDKKSMVDMTNPNNPISIPVLNGGVYITTKANSINLNNNFVCIGTQRFATRGFTYAGTTAGSCLIFNKLYEPESIYESKLIEMNGDEKRMIFGMSDNLKTGNKYEVIMYNDPSISYVGGWVAETETIPYASINTTEDYSKTIYKTNVNGDYLIYTIPIGTSKIGMINRYTTTYGQLRVMIFEGPYESGMEESGFESGGGITPIYDFTYDFNENADDYRRLLWIYESLDPTIQYSIKIIVETASDYVYFNAFVLDKPLLNNDNVKVWVTPNNLDWFEITENNELEFLKTIEEIKPASGIPESGMVVEWIDDDKLEINENILDIKNVYLKKYGDTDYTELVKNYEYSFASTTSSTIITFLRNIPAELDEVKVEYYVKPTQAKVRIIMKQPYESGTDFYDEFVENYISDFGIYFSS